MKKLSLKLAALAVLILCLCIQNVNAQKNNQNSQNNQNSNNQNNNNQNNESNPYPVLSKVRPHNEVKVQPEKSKEKSKDPNYDSNGTLRFSASFMRWYNENITPNSGTPDNPSYPDNNNSSGHGPFFNNAGNGFNASTAAIGATKNYYFSYGIGIGISMKGGKYPDGDVTDVENLWYIQIPIMARFNYVLNNGGTAFIGAGPYYGIAIAGNYKDGGEKVKDKFGNNPDEDDYRRGDFGIKIGLGYKLQSQPIFLGLTTDIGLRNIIPGGGNEEKITNQSIGLMIGYVFE